MTSARIRPAAFAAALATLLAPPCALAAPTTTIHVGASISLGNALVDVVGAFEAYYFERQVAYDIGVTTDTNAHLKAAVVDGTGEYDLILTDDRALARELAAKHASSTQGGAFVFARDRLDLYAVAVDVSHVPDGLKPNFAGPLVVPDPTSDAYGAAAARLLAGVPWFIDTIPDDRVAVQPDVTVVQAAVELGLNPYGLLAKSAICRNLEGAETYPEGSSHHEYRPLHGLRYGAIEPSGIETASATRTPDQATELADFVDFVRGVGTTQGTDVLRRYCYTLPHGDGE